MWKTEKAIVKESVVEMDIKEIIPYWKNARTGANVEMVKKSIQEFGYNSYIVVDAGNVIIAGHSRYKALLDLWYKKIMVVKTSLSEHEAKKYRLIDNKIQEANERDNDILQLELRDIGDDAFIIEAFDIDLDDVQATNFDWDEVTPLDVAEHKGTMDSRFEERSSDRNEAQAKSVTCVTCPYCYKEFNMT